MERVAKNEEEDIDVEDDQAEPEEPKIPPPEKVSMEIQTDDSFMSDQKIGSSSEEEGPAPPGSSQKGEEPEEKKDDIQHDDTAPKKEPTTRFYHGQHITGTEDDRIFENFPSVLPTTTIMNGQVSTIKVIQLQVSIDTFSGMLSTRRPANHTKTTGTPTLTGNWWKLTLPDIRMNTHCHC